MPAITRSRTAKTFSQTAEPVYKPKAAPATLKATTKATTKEAPQNSRRAKCRNADLVTAEAIAAHEVKEAEIAERVVSTGFGYAVSTSHARYSVETIVAK